MSHSIRLNNGIEMPMIGFGTYQIFDFVLSEDEMKKIASLDLDRSMFNWW